MAAGPCWVCHEPVPLAEARRSDEILGFAKITMARFVSERGVKDCSSYNVSEPVCNGCMSLVSKLDLVTFEADEYLRQLQERVVQADGPVKEEAVRVPITVAWEPARIAGTNVKVVPRIVLERLTAEEFWQWTKTASHNPSDEQRNSQEDRTSLGAIPNLTSEAAEEPAGSMSGEEMGIDSSEPSRLGSDDDACSPFLAESSPSSPGCPSKDVASTSRQPRLMEILQKGVSDAQLPANPTSEIEAREDNDVAIPEVHNDESSDGGRTSGDEMQFVKPKRKRKKRSVKPETIVNLDKLSIPRSSFKVEDGLFKCETCEFSSKTPYSLERHVNEVHLNVQPFECDECKKRFGSKFGLKCHKKELHSTAPKTLCPCCGKRFSTPSTMRRHRENERLRSEGNWEECDVCGQMVINLKRHRQRKHSATKRKCTECDQEFISFFALRNHKVKEHGVNKCPSLTCKHCGSFHTSTMLLNRHLVKKHGVNLPEGTVFNCPQCSRVFFARMFLEDHLNYHNNETPYNCPLCDYKTWGRVMLNQHTRKSHNLSARNARKAASSDVSSSNG